MSIYRLPAGELVDRYYIFFSIIFLSIVNKSLAQSDHILWYDKPATYFEETLPLGNGTMGATVFGGVQVDSIYLNDATLWSGEPITPNNNPSAYKYVPKIREALKNENYQLADKLQHKLQGKFSESYLPLGTFTLQFKDQENYKNYKRKLDISKAVANISYQSNGVNYKREYFVSHSDEVMVIKLTADKKNALNLKLKFDSPLKYKVIPSENNQIFEVNGYAPYHVEPNYRGDMPDAIQFDAERGTRFSLRYKIAHTDGKVKITKNYIAISNSSEATIYITEATSFNGFDKNPATEGKPYKKIADQKLERALEQSFQQLKAKHIKDYQHYFNRVSLTLGETTAPKLPTDKRLLRYGEGKEDKNLEALYFQYGRYLLISSSRTPEVPANLQGIWNPYMRPPWSSNYTLNINLEENYWLAETGNLSELHQPLLGFIENLSKTGAITAKTYYGTEGWSASQNSDIWALTNPVGDFGQGDPNWANWNMGGVWLTSHLWEHYAFTKDSEYLKEKAYPLMKGAVKFCLDWMVKDENGYYITSPATSPENKYVTPDGYIGATLYGATADVAMIRELFSEFLAASEVLHIANDLTKEVAKAKEELLPYKIGEKGNLQEWYYDWEDENPKHRHQSHLYGLYPGQQINIDKSPALALASVKTLEIKGDETTGWSKGWRINLWARLWDGDHAYKMYRELLSYVDPDNFNGEHSGHGGTYPNLFDAHPPFQIDGNFGGAAAVVEMLMQSNSHEIYLLPALPDAWNEGNVSGICARGGFIVDLNWEKGKLKYSTITARKSGETVLKYEDTEKKIQLEKGESCTINW